MSKDYLILIGAAIVLAMVVAVALVAVSVHTLKAAMTDPVKSLRYV